jgi:hypothetical protein
MLLPLSFDSATESFATQEVRDLIRSFKPAALFPDAKEPEAPLAGLWLYFACLEEAHNLAQDCKTNEGDLWHALVHRYEGDSGNAAYWFRRAGKHPMYLRLAEAAVKITRHHPETEFRAGTWDPFAFLVFCDRAKTQPGSIHERMAMEIQRAEWQILFDYSARPQLQ